MQISVPVTDYIRASVLTTDLDRVIRLANVPARLAPAILPIVGGYFNFKEVSIDDWNMDTTQFHQEAHGLTLADIIFCYVLIVNDAGTQKYPIYVDIGSAGVVEADFLLTATQISMSRLTGGGFDDPDFSTTPGNRGSALLIYKS